MNIFNTLKQAIAIATLVTTVHSKALAENLSLNDKQDHSITALSENNTDSITAVVRNIVNEQSQLENRLKQIEAEIAELEKGTPSMINNEEGFTRSLSEEEIKQIKDRISSIKLSEEQNGIKEEIACREQEAEKGLKVLEDAATYRYLSSSTEKKD